MEITSVYFGLSALAASIVFYLINQKFRVIFLVFLSCAFIATLSYYLVIYVIAFSFFNYYFGIKIPSVRLKKTWFRIGIVINLCQLIFLRYATFAIDPIFGAFNSTIEVSAVSRIIIPLGISYFTLQGIGYLVNVKMGWEKPEKKFLEFLLYISFYPKFISGPIERSNHFLPQLKNQHNFNQQQVVDGLRIALFGFFKKIAIANQMAPFLTSTYANLNTADGSSLWVLLLIQPLYLYFDFSGYTDIAIGISKTLGIDLLPNFNRPFFSENMTTFWKRFHMSLSFWFNDYVFKQTSFKYRRWGIYSSVYALLLTWTLFGIWHGAGWNFMLLGLAQALALIYEFFTKKWRVRLFSKLPDYFKIWVGRIITYFFYGGSLVFFFSPNLKSTFLYFSKLFNVSGSIISTAYRVIPLSAMVFMFVFLLIEFINNDYESVSNKLNKFWTADNKINKLFRWATYSSVLAILFVLGTKVQQFIYAQF